MVAYGDGAAEGYVSDLRGDCDCAAGIAGDVEGGLRRAGTAWKGYEDSSATWKNLEELYLEAKEVVDEMFSSEWDGNKISKALRKEYERLQDEHA